MDFKRHIPNTLTCCNLVSGCIAVYFAFLGAPAWALLWIIVGAVFDFLDGLTARLLRVSSPIGKELDSLADDVTFGVAPATMVFSELQVLDYPSLFFRPLWGTGATLAAVVPFLAFAMAAFSALRLAKFNLDTRQTTSFIGMPTPANALFWGSLLSAHSAWLETSRWMPFVVLAMVGLSCWLLVSEIPMFALKFKQWGWRGNEVRYLFVGVSAVLMAALGFLQSFWLIILLYVAVSVVMAILDKGSQPS